MSGWPGPVRNIVFATGMRHVEDHGRVGLGSAAGEEQVAAVVPDHRARPERHLRGAGRVRKELHGDEAAEPGCLPPRRVAWPYADASVGDADEVSRSSYRRYARRRLHTA
mgnify:CR=1 FL=1